MKRFIALILCLICIVPITSYSQARFQLSASSGLSAEGAVVVHWPIIVADTAETSSSSTSIIATSHVARIGDILEFTSGTAANIGVWAPVLNIVDANTIKLAAALPAAPVNGDGFVIRRALALDNGPATMFHLYSAASNNSTSIKASPGVVYSISSCGGTGTNYWIKLYDKASAPTCASDAVSLNMASGNSNGCVVNNLGPYGLKFTAGIGICVVANAVESDNTSAGAGGAIITIGYK